ncbi:3886_t:CDS:2, partial [Paraglomus brasilianum]
KYLLNVLNKRTWADHWLSPSSSNDRESIHLSVITAEQVLAESKIPWERCFVPHKVIHVPYKDDKEETKKRRKRRKSKKRRDAEKRGIIKKQTRFCPRLSKADQSYTYGYRSRRRIINIDKVNSTRLDMYNSGSGTQGTNAEGRRIIRNDSSSNDKESLRHNNWVSSRGRERELHRHRGRAKWNSRGRF